MGARRMRRRAHSISSAPFFPDDAYDEDARAPGAGCLAPSADRLQPAGAGIGPAAAADTRAALAGTGRILHACVPCRRGRPGRYPARRANRTTHAAFAPDGWAGAVGSGRTRRPAGRGCAAHDALSRRAPCAGALRPHLHPLELCIRSGFGCGRRASRARAASTVGAFAGGGWSTRRFTGEYGTGAARSCSPRYGGSACSHIRSAACPHTCPHICPHICPHARPHACTK
jgi:hypothetical protein